MPLLTTSATTSRYSRTLECSQQDLSTSFCHSLSMAVLASGVLSISAWLTTRATKACCSRLTASNFCQYKDAILSLWGSTVLRTIGIADDWHRWRSVAFRLLPGSCLPSEFGLITLLISLPLSGGHHAPVLARGVRRPLRALLVSNQPHPIKGALRTSVDSVGYRGMRLADKPQAPIRKLHPDCLRLL